MKVLTFSRHFPAGHPKSGMQTYFVEKVWKSIWDDHSGSNNPLYPWWEQYDQAFPQWVKGFDANENIHQHKPKHHTIRSGTRWKAGDMASLRVWSDKPYRSKQIEFAQVEVKRVWAFNIHTVADDLLWQIPGVGGGDFETRCGGLEIIAQNDGLAVRDFLDWFSIHPKAKGNVFAGQIICWSPSINYNLTEKA
jgi:hypothetical protein